MPLAIGKMREECEGRLTGSAGSWSMQRPVAAAQRCTSPCAALAQHHYNIDALANAGPLSVSIRHTATSHAI